MGLPDVVSQQNMTYRSTINPRLSPEKQQQQQQQLSFWHGACKHRWVQAATWAKKAFLADCYQLDDRVSICTRAAPPI